MKIKIQGVDLQLPFSEERYSAIASDRTPDSLQTTFKNFEDGGGNGGGMAYFLALGLYLGLHASNGGKAEVSQIKSGRNKGQWRFKLIGENGEPVEPTNEKYHNYFDMMATISKYFPNFEVCEP